MHPSLRSTATIFLLNSLVILSLIPQSASSRPIMVFKHGADRSTHVSTPSYMKDQEKFDNIFLVAWLLALFGVWAWVANRITVSRLVGRIHWLVLAPSTSIQRVLSFIPDTYNWVATVFTFGVNDAPRGPAYLQAIGGLSRPMAFVIAPLTQPQRARFPVESLSARGYISRVLGRGRETARSTSPV